MGVTGSMAWGRPGTSADASCQDHPDTTGREDCVAGGPGMCPVPPPQPVPVLLGWWSQTTLLPLALFSLLGPWGLDNSDCFGHWPVVGRRAEPRVSHYAWFYGP